MKSICEEVRRIEAIVQYWRDFVPVLSEAATDADLDLIEESDPALLEQYFRGDLTIDQKSLVEHWAKVSDYYRQDLIDAGELAMGIDL